MKPRYRIHLDGALSLVACDHDHYRRLLGVADRFIAARSDAPVNAELIKAGIRMRATTCVAIALKLGVSKNLVSNVIHGRVTSRRVASAIAATLEKPIEQIWPGRYETKRRARASS